MTQLLSPVPGTAHTGFHPPFQADLQERKNANADIWLSFLFTGLRALVFSAVLVGPVAAFAHAQAQKEHSRSIGLVLLVSIQRAG